MNVKVWLIFFMLIPCFIFPQEVKIAKALDSNLFLLEDGRKIKLAHIEMPSIQAKDSLQRELASRIIQFAEERMLKKRFEIELAADHDTATALAVHLFEKYPLQRLNYNAIFLENGFGKYVGMDSIYDEQYLKAQQKVKNARSGAWNPPYFGTPFRGYYRYGVFAGLGDVDPVDGIDGNGSFTEAGMFLRVENQNLSGTEVSFGILRRVEEGYSSYFDEPTKKYRYRTISHVRYVKVRFDANNWKYFGGSLSLIYFNFDRGYCDEGPTAWLVPSLQINAGLMRKAYLSFNLINNKLGFPFSVLNIDVNYHFLNPHNQLSIGYIITTAEHEGFYNGLEIFSSFHVSNRFLFQAQGTYYPTPERYLLKVGCAMVIPVGY